MKPEPKIEKNIPLPKPNQRGRSGRDWLKYLQTMTVTTPAQTGDSFIIDGVVSQATLYSAVKGSDVKIQFRKTREGRRVWRVK